MCSSNSASPESGEAWLACGVGKDARNESDLGAWKAWGATSNIRANANARGRGSANRRKWKKRFRKLKDCGVSLASAAILWANQGLQATGYDRASWASRISSGSDAKAFFKTLLSDSER